MNAFLRLPTPNKKSPQQNFPSYTGGISSPTPWNYLENPAMLCHVCFNQQNNFCPAFCLSEVGQMSIKNFWELIGKK